MAKSEPTTTTIVTLEDIANVIPAGCELTNRQLMARVMGDARLRAAVDLMAVLFDERSKQIWFEVAVVGRDVQVKPGGAWRKVTLPVESFH